MNFSNVTFPDFDDDDYKNWDFLPIIQIVTSVAAFFFNAAVLCCYTLYRRLRTPFSIYLMALCVANLAHTIFASPIDILKMVHPTYVLGPRTCNFYVYAAYNTAGTTLNLHLLISLNRIWAMAHPFSYRTKHTTRIAAAACLTVTAYVHLICVPGIVQDSLYYRIPGTCFINGTAQPRWTVFMQIVIFSLPIICIAIFYPFITWKHCQRGKLHPHERTEVHSVDHAQRRTTILPRSAVLSVAPVPVLQQQQSRRESMSRAFVVLTLLTISLIICEAPINTFFLIMTVAPQALPMLETVGVVLYSLQPAMDPLLFIVSFRDLRRQLFRMLLCR
ncbi:muscarinic acetylcholine receptor M4-like [Paramacrobiotus metropolitanus]|uniref:muscarinic acetylcholine receptor M4-like n=1 Tax=Paramacrobiotus metropolitanus TaxID=2943436 RepID=UPI0024456E64|nr:muscarinic acetylcholine receptor M4-like [Paramacrobiotus metropolitanus]